MGHNRVIYITGGQRSGKSAFAEKFVREISSAPVYLATAGIRDEEMMDRVTKHRLRRGDTWQTIESQLHFDTDLSGRTVLLDCLTMFASNHFFHEHENVEKSSHSILKEIDKLFSYDNATIVVVSNEIGLGGISANKMQRKFADLQGQINQYVALRADEAYMIISGIPLKMK